MSFRSERSVVKESQINQIKFKVRVKIEIRDDLSAVVPILRSAGRKDLFMKISF